MVSSTGIAASRVPASNAEGFGMSGADGPAVGANLLLIHTVLKSYNENAR